MKRGENKLKAYNEHEQIYIRRGLTENFHKKYNPHDRNIKKVGAKLYDTVTGEDVTHLYELSYKTSENKARHYRLSRKLNKHDAENGSHVIVFFRQLIGIEKEFPTLTKQDIARLLYLSTFIKYESNRIQSDNGRKIYDKKDLEAMFEMSTKRFNEFFKRLENENIIQETATGEIYLNPTVAYFGHLKSIPYDISDLQHTRLFKRTVRNLYQQFKGRKLGQLSVIYSILPYLNFSSNIICHNPNETASKLIKPMNLKELADILGYENVSRLKTILNDIKIDNEYVFVFADNPDDRRQKRIVVNPRVVFAGNGEQLEAIKVLFNY